jgi:hypothetical protein
MDLNVFDYVHLQKNIFHGHHQDHLCGEAEENTFKDLIRNNLRILL